MKCRKQPSWWELPAFMLPALTLVSLIFYTAWANWWI